MDFFDVIMIFGGVALFLFGMSVMSTGLEKSAGGKLERILRNATSNPPKAFILGIGVTSIIQSSSAVTVMLVGLVNSGIMKLHQTIGVIMGTNVGTTVTAWILSLIGISESNFVSQMLKPDNFAHIFAVVGAVFIMFSKKEKRKSVGGILMGFAVLMAGMTVMSSAVEGLENSETFGRFMSLFSNPLLGVLLGVVMASILQSSSASVGIVQILSQSVNIPYALAIPIIMGQNIGTCITALLASFGTSRNAKRVAIVHIYFNLFGTAVFLILLYLVQYLAKPAFLAEFVSPVTIAVIHTAFNLATTLMLIPFAKQIEKLAIKTVKDAPGEKQRYAFIDERLQATPGIAIAQCRNMVIEMGHMARTTVFLALDTVLKYDGASAEIIRANEEHLDQYEDSLNTFLVNLSAHEMSAGDRWQAAEFLHVIGDLERMGDHALNILQSAEEMRDKEIEFSEGAKADIVLAHKALREIIDLTAGAFDNSDNETARRVEPLEQVIDALTVKMRSRHIERLQNGECGITAGFVWSDLLINYERVSDHCSNMAISVIQTSGQTMDRHNYLSVTRTPDNAEFSSAYDAYAEKYGLS